MHVKKAKFFYFKIEMKYKIRPIILSNRRGIIYRNRGMHKFRSSIKLFSLSLRFLHTI